MELDDKVYEKITKLCKRGNELFEIKKLDDAIKKYNKAIDLIPSPKTDWEAGLWLYTALGDVYFLKKDYEKAEINLYNAINCPNGIINPFVLCRLGQTLYELNDFDNAKGYLLKAFLLDGYKVFEGENLKYINFIKQEIQEDN